MNEMLAMLEKNGYVVTPNVLTPNESAATARALGRISLRGAGSRNLLSIPWCRAVVQRVRNRLESNGALPASSVAVQCTLFDKTPQRNWLVALHQDLSIPVRTRVSDPLLTIWSKKEGHNFVQPPTEVLERLLAVRVHIDDCGQENGPLRVVPGSHHSGRVSDADARQLRKTHGEVPCVAKSGDALLMRPLVLHASSKALTPKRRRVLHFLFGPQSLPYGLEWQHAV